MGKIKILGVAAIAALVLTFGVFAESSSTAEAAVDQPSVEVVQEAPSAPVAWPCERDEHWVWDWDIFNGSVGRCLPNRDEIKCQDGGDRVPYRRQMAACLN